MVGINKTEGSEKMGDIDQSKENNMVGKDQNTRLLPSS